MERAFFCHETRNIELVRKLLNYGRALLDEKFWGERQCSALHVAVMRQDLPLLKLLCDKKPELMQEVDAVKGDTAAHFAVRVPCIKSLNFKCINNDTHLSRALILFLPGDTNAFLA